MRKDMVDMVMKLKFGIKKYFQVLNRITPRKIYFSFTYVKYHIVSSAPILFRVNRP
jgi:hypothetical protein